MGSRKKGRPKTKNHAQDGERLSAMPRQHPAILPWFSVLGWRPSFRIKSRAPCPSCPAAGLLLDFRIGRDLSESCPCASSVSKNEIQFSNDDTKTRAERRACTSKQTQRRMLCFSRSAL